MKKIPLIWVVDDDEDDQFLLSTVAREGHHPCELIFARDGQQALDLLSSHSVDLMITDLNMPRMDGMELLREIKSSASWHRIPVLMLSTSCNQQTMDTAIAYGAIRFICKPTTLEALAQVWQEIFAHPTLDLRQESTLEN